MKTPEEILLEFYGSPTGKITVTDGQKIFYRVSVEDCLKLMKISQKENIELLKEIFEEVNLADTSIDLYKRVEDIVCNLGNEKI